MPFPSDTPKLPKWAFFVGTAVLLATVWFLQDGAARPFTLTVILAITACAVVGVFLLSYPYIVDYARKQDEALDDRQRALQALAVTVASASEQVSIAATGLQGIAEAAQDNFDKTEKLAVQIAEKVAELDARLAAGTRADGDAAGRLEAVAKKIGKAAAEMEGTVAKASADLAAAAAKAAEAARAVPPPHIPEVPPVLMSRIVEIRPAVIDSEHPFIPPAAPAAPAPAEPVSEAPTEQLADPAPEPAALPPTEPAPAPAPRKRAPRKPAPVAESTPAAETVLAEQEPAPSTPTPPPPAEPELLPPEVVLEAAVLDEPAAAAPEIPEPAVSADGATRLIVTAYIGIGNRLFIRGDGPGLAWDKGVPLTFVSIGKWRWETNDAVSTVKFRLFKNDAIECTALGEQRVEPGAQGEFTASF
jgi:hypothetical protein